MTPLKRVLMLTNKLMHYRIPILNIVAQKYDLTVAYTEGEVPNLPIKFKHVKLNSTKKWKFIIHKDNISKMCEDYDVVIGIAELARLKVTALAFKHSRKFKLIYWGIGVPASYNRKYGEANKFHYFISESIYKRGDAFIAYSESATKILVSHKFNSHKLFAAHNTIAVPEFEDNEERNCIIFLGTLYPQKGISTLLDAYKKASTIHPNLIPLKIIGDGILREEINQWIKNNKLGHKITMLGALYRAEEKLPIMKKAVACISPNQAGLAVLECMGYGIPYVTTKDAITGGEAFNIEHNKTGLRIDSDSEIANIIIDITNNKQKYINMGVEAQHFYRKCRKAEHMAQGIIDAIEFVIQ